MPTIINERIASIVIDKEYQVAQSNARERNDELEDAVNMLECERTQKEYDWMSDIFIPEFPSHVLTQASNDAAQMFTTRDFTSVYLEDGRPEAKAKAGAAKECINRTLNQRHMHFFMKFIRSKMLNMLGGYVYIRCWWDQEFEREIIEDELGNMEIEDLRTMDRFDFDVFDSRNVFTDNSYVYSIQDKPWISLRFERTLQQLKAEGDKLNYQNLDEVEKLNTQGETETSKESYNKEDAETKMIDLSAPFDILERHGKFWCIVDEVDDDGYPLEVSPGIDEHGMPIDNAEFIETIITFVLSGNSRVMIRFQPQPYVDSLGRPFKPLIRGLCYIHPTKDTGLSDAKLASELQVALNDTFNLGMDRTILATMPTMRGRRGMLEDNTDIHFAPGHTIFVNEMDDLQEFEIKDDIMGSLRQQEVLVDKMRQVTSTYQPAMGQVPEDASTTATATAAASAGTNTRMNFKSLVFEHTFLTELYWMILQMTHQFASPDTAVAVMGDKAEDFDPYGDYIYKPVSQGIESEQSKQAKIDRFIQVAGLVQNLQNPKAPAMFNMIVARIMELMGDEFEEYADALLDEGAGPLGGGASPENTTEPTQNQTGLPMSIEEQGIRNV
jgi:hypothetical protein